MVKLRLKRMGRRNRPFYRVCAFDARTKRDGKPIEQLGVFDPLDQNDDTAIELNAERVEYWLGVGAQPSDRVASLLRKAGIIEGKAEAETTG
ncbi:MAG: 30S ribosomal protein S16 [Phycisphaeraceae bacterium]|nr:30S ribosomal protein S16 [Phycisphaeraceae bacterium]